MSEALSDEARERLADVVELQPTKNSELGKRWGMDSGSEVHGYLEDVLGEYYYRDDNSLIRATDEAAELVDVEPGVTNGGDGTPDAISVPPIQARAFAVLAGPGERSESVVSVLHAIREEYGMDPSTDDVREALQALRRKDVVEVVQRTVPTYRRTVEHSDLDVTETDGS
ncbi:hypothetical protein BRD00_12865 [Halobacteriales archaeon QS_8_69_26]|nr:MAG: hypothetical protein BRD00_12865 [Halobacteriales archaeon QS_8_69_26]